MMKLQQQLKQITAAGFDRMPQPIAKILVDGIEEIKNDGLKNRALKVGDSIPDFQLTDINYQQHTLSNLMHKDFLVLNFYRGGWCPYCNMELRAYEKLRADFLAINTDIIAISAEKSTFAAATINKNQITYPILTDTAAELMKKIGIVFQLNEQLRIEYKKFGIDLTRLHENTNDELAIPAIYVINKDLKVVFVHIEENYMTRLEPNDLLTILTKKALIAA